MKYKSIMDLILNFREIKIKLASENKSLKNCTSIAHIKSVKWFFFFFFNLTKFSFFLSKFN